MARRSLSELRRRWWASMTLEQREAHKLKQKAGRAAAFAKRRRLEREWLRKVLRGAHAS